MSDVDYSDMIAYFKDTNVDNMAIYDFKVGDKVKCFRKYDGTFVDGPTQTITQADFGCLVGLDNDPQLVNIVHYVHA
jgi:hypothetical protein